MSRNFKHYICYGYIKHKLFKGNPSVCIDIEKLSSFYYLIFWFIEKLGIEWERWGCVCVCIYIESDYVIWLLCIQLCCFLKLYLETDNLTKY